MNQNLNYKTKIDSLTGIRAIAAYLVYLCHLIYYYPNLANKKIGLFLSELYIGVTLFFVLSGFLITYNYYDVKPFNFKKYILRRFARIYPVFFILTTAVFVQLFVNKSNVSFYDIKVYLLNITFLKSFFEQFLRTGIAPSWTLTLEEIFYFICPILFLIARKSKYYLIFVSIIFLFIGLVIVKLFESNYYYGFFQDTSFMFNYTIFGRISEFLAGMFLVFFIQKFRYKFKTNYLTYLGLLNIILCVVALTFFKNNNLLTDGFDSIYGKIINTFILPLLGILPFYWGLITEKTILSKILETQLLKILGKSSYIFYLIHITYILWQKNLDFSNYLAHFVFLNIISVVLYFSIEFPIHNFLRKKIDSVD